MLQHQLFVWFLSSAYCCLNKWAGSYYVKEIARLSVNLLAAAATAVSCHQATLVMLFCCIPAEICTSSVDYFMSENERWQGSSADCEKGALRETVEKKQGLVPLCNMFEICLIFTRDTHTHKHNTKWKVSVDFFFFFLVSQLNNLKRE